jgi:hypothetical protein
MRGGFLNSGESLHCKGSVAALRWVFDTTTWANIGRDLIELLMLQMARDKIMPALPARAIPSPHEACSISNTTMCNNGR